MIKLRNINYRHYICLAITLAFISLAVFAFPIAIGRIIEGCRDFGISVARFFCELFKIDNNLIITVNDMPKYPFFDNSSTTVTPPSTIIPNNFDDFKADWYNYWQLWVTKDNFNNYIGLVGRFTFLVVQFIAVLLPFVMLLFALLQRFIKTKINDTNIDSKQLKVYKVLAKYIFAPIIDWIRDFVCFVKERKVYYIIWVVIWVYNFNIFAIALEFVAFYLYFVVSFDFINIYTQVYKLFLDLSTMFTVIPLYGWVIIGLLVIDHFRKNIAFARLNHMERKNRGFINARPIVCMVCGTMGKKKTTTITDIALSQEVLFRDKAFEKILENDLKFPHFPWINFEKALQKAMDNHSVYNLATCRRFVMSKCKKWQKRPLMYYAFGYDYYRYGITYNDELRTVGLWEVLESYAQLYFIYIIQSSLLISNYSIRTDNMLSDMGNFPLWNSDFFKRDSKLLDSFSRHAHILDFDSLRLGKKVIDENPNANNFEFGVVVVTEIGKERGNTLELKEAKKGADTANQKNDLFNSWLKMVRHSATVDNFPFVKVIVDEQRPESWGADARDLCEIVHIRESDETKLAMPFFTLGELLYSTIFYKFKALYYEYRYIRSDNTLSMHLLKSITAKAHHYYEGIYNRFGYCKLRVQLESGTQDGHIDENCYYLMSKKIYSKRFSTDCFSDFFTEKALHSPVGLDDLAEYMRVKASFNELAQQNSYFIDDLLRGLNK